LRAKQGQDRQRGGSSQVQDQVGDRAIIQAAGLRQDEGDQDGYGAKNLG